MSNPKQFRLSGNLFVSLEKTISQLSITIIDEENLDQVFQEEKLSLGSKLDRVFEVASEATTKVLHRTPEGIEIGIPEACWSHILPRAMLFGEDKLSWQVRLLRFQIAELKRSKLSEEGGSEVKKLQDDFAALRQEHAALKLQLQQDLPAGAVRQVRVFENSTRRVLPLSSKIDMETFTFTPKSVNSTLLIQGSISGFGGYSRDLQQVWKFGSRVTFAQSAASNGVGWGQAHSTFAAIPGPLPSVDSQELVFEYQAFNGDTNNRPFSVYNPNSTDEPRLGQTKSVFVVTEIAL